MEKTIKLKPLDYDNLDLRNKTPYDFTDDEEILESLGFSYNPLFNGLLNVIHDDNERAYKLLFCAERIGDKKLIQAVKKEFYKELNWGLE